MLQDRAPTCVECKFKLNKKKVTKLLGFLIAECSIPAFDNGFTSPRFNAAIGETVEYFCNSGFELVGDGLRLCRGDATLSVEIPFCRRSMKLFFFLL